MIHVLFLLVAMNDAWQYCTLLVAWLSSTSLNLIHGVLDCVGALVQTASQSCRIVIAQVAVDLWQHKQTLSSSCALGLGSFTAINSWPRALTLTSNT